jgi:SAM-dependent methyltransferase
VAVARVGESLLNEFLPARADIVIMMGVLHHMDDALACRSLRLAAGLLTDGGRFVAFDPGIVAGQPAIARFLAERDRGQHVRDVDATRTLLNQAFSQVDIDVHHDFLALPYTHIVAEATGPIVADGTSVSDARSI